ncbi:hypothetical protein, partial [Klebsiella michiganensis]
KNPNGYEEFRPQFLTANTLLIRVQSLAQDQDQRFRFLVPTLATVLQASGVGAAAGSYPIHITGQTGAATISCNGYGVAVCPDPDQTATVASATTN